MKLCAFSDYIEQNDAAKGNAVKERFIFWICAQGFNQLPVVAHHSLESPSPFRVSVTSIVIDEEISTAVGKSAQLVEQMIREHSVSLGDQDKSFTRRRSLWSCFCGDLVASKEPPAPCLVRDGRRAGQEMQDIGIRRSRRSTPSRKSEPFLKPAANCFFEIVGRLIGGNKSSAEDTEQDDQNQAAKKNF